MEGTIHQIHNEQLTNDIPNIWGIHDETPGCLQGGEPY